MAHIATCITDLEPNSSPTCGSSVPSMLSATPPVPSQKPYPWRMQSEAPRKYQLFPKGRQSHSANNSVSLDPEKAFALAMGQNSEKGDKMPPTSGLKIRINQSNLGRRRKISVPQLGPMTTVQESAMDSPTIPGRPPIRERSISAPEERCKQDEPPLPSPNLQTLSDAVYKPSKKTEVKRKPVGSQPPRLPSPRRLAPLVIPGTTPGSALPELRRPPPFTHMRSDSTPLLGMSQSNRLENLPMQYRFTPAASAPNLGTYPLSASTDSLSAATLPTPVSAPLSAKPWERCGQMPANAPALENGLERNHGHRRFASESSSIMDRGRPRKRIDTRNISSPQSSFTLVKRSKSSERRAFEELPQGWKPGDAADQMNANDLATLRKQALAQAERFEVLRVEDVESLSKELRQLDERTEYLRRTYNSLRAGRRNLQSRICQYLRSPRVAKFSHESMLKQEEALAELDASIDDWVVKLERAENRRTRVRQKLLEHVAAASVLAISGAEFPPQPLPPGPRDISTPPRSPSSRTGNTSPSPPRVVAQVPSTIVELSALEEAEAEDKDGMLSRQSTLKRSDVESIRIYAGDELLALFTDVEEHIYRMSCAAPDGSSPPGSESQWMERGGRRSHEKLSGQPDSPTLAMESIPILAAAPVKQTVTVQSTKPTKPTITVPPPIDLNAAVPLSPPAPTPPMKDSPKKSEFFLTNAVFKPQ